MTLQKKATCEKQYHAAMQHFVYTQMGLYAVLAVAWGLSCGTQWLFHTSQLTLLIANFLSVLIAIVCIASIVGLAGMAAPVARSSTQILTGIMGSTALIGTEIINMLYQDTLVHVLTCEFAMLLGLLAATVIISFAIQMARSERTLMIRSVTTHVTFSTISIMASSWIVLILQSPALWNAISLRNRNPLLAQLHPYRALFQDITVVIGVIGICATMILLSTYCFRSTMVIDPDNPGVMMGKNKSDDNQQSDVQDTSESDALSISQADSADTTITEHGSADNQLQIAEHTLTTFSTTPYAAFMASIVPTIISGIVILTIITVGICIL